MDEQHHVSRRGRNKHFDCTCHPKAQCRLYVSHVMFRLKPHPRQTVAAVVKVCRLWLGRSGVEKCRVDHKIGSKTFMHSRLPHADALLRRALLHAVQCPNVLELAAVA